MAPFLFGASVLLMCVGAAILFFSPLAAIQFIDVSASKGIDSTAVRSVVFRQMDKQRYMVFSQKNIFLLSRKDLERELKKEFLIDSFFLQRKPPHTLSLTISGKPFRLLWVAPDATYDVSSDGILVRTIDASSLTASNIRSLQPYTQQGSYPQKNASFRTDIPTVLDEGQHAPYVLGDSVLLPDTLRFILDAWRMLDESGIRLSYATLIPDNPTITFRTAQGWSTLLSVISDPKAQVDHIRQVIAQNPKKKLRGIQYIDARFDNRVYVK
jgi:hypothetical protein